MKIVLSLLFICHGLLHLLGFMKAFGLAALPQLSRSIGKTEGLVWLLVTLLFVLALGWMWMRQTDWFWLAGIAVLISQVLILLNWQDARFGTGANFIIFLSIFIAFGHWQFNQAVQQEVSKLDLQTLPATEKVRAEQLQALPPVVQSWLKRTGIVDKPFIWMAKLQQQGKMRTKPTGTWVPVKSLQYFKTQVPAFGWQAKMTFFPGLDILGWDSYLEGKGRMQIKALGLFPIADAQGPSIDQGTLLRYLAEIVWFPSAALAPYIQWDGIDQSSAKATITHGELSTSAIFYFAPEGDVKNIEALRYYERQSGATLEKWWIEIDPSGYREFEGIRIPTRSSVTWQLKEGDFTWYHLEITQANYNVL